MSHIFTKFYSGIKYTIDILPVICVRKNESGFELTDSRVKIDDRVLILSGALYFLTHLFVLILLSTSIITEQMLLIINTTNKPHYLSTAAESDRPNRGGEHLKMKTLRC